MHDLIQYFLVLPIFKKSMNNPSIFCDKPVISPPIFSGQRKIGISLGGSLRVQWGPDRLQLEITGDETKKKGKKKQIKLLRRKKEPLLPSSQWVQPASCLSKHLHLPAQPKEERKTEISEGIYSQRGPERGVWLVQGPPPARRRGGGG